MNTHYIPRAAVQELAKHINDLPSVSDALAYGVVFAAFIATVLAVPALVLYAALKCCGVIS